MFKYQLPGILFVTVPFEIAGVMMNAYLGFMTGMFNFTNVDLQDVPK